MIKSRNINHPKVRPTDQQVAVICNLYPFLLPYRLTPCKGMLGIFETGLNL